MKKFTLSVCILVAIAGLSIPAMAQTPNVTGAADYDTAHHQDFYYWSVYGSNLSTGHSEVFWVYYEGPPNDPNSNDWIGLEEGESSTLNKPTYWYESSSQINFYFFAGTDPGDVLEYTGFLWVCDLNTSQCSNHLQWFFN